MKTKLFFVIVTSFIFINIGICQEYDKNFDPASFTGEIVFKDGSSVKYNWICRIHGGNYATIHFSKGNIEKNVPGTYFRFDKLARIDFYDLTSDELSKSSSVLKGKVTFTDNTIMDNLYIYLYWGTWQYKTDKFEGVINKDVKSITFQKINAKKCKKCLHNFFDDEYKFCPYDGSSL